MKTITLIAVAVELWSVLCGSNNPLSKKGKIVHRTPYGELNEHVKRKQNE